MPSVLLMGDTGAAVVAVSLHSAPSGPQYPHRVCTISNAEHRVFGGRGPILDRVSTWERDDWRNRKSTGDLGCDYTRFQLHQFGRLFQPPPQGEAGQGKARQGGDDEVLRLAIGANYPDKWCIKADRGNGQGEK
ncbi:hypothetical protein CPLU01_02852 [Colletotrichum plurivorum]|uniref:Uncharacterized protein n=1 Tax=Colletotrichum plurivorum TaxID=2175906 RepID=A0A8H6KV61_9PEZI|nr:hypothetical protein CPLU01_02852 [Colletotrichum plurivorum]